MATSSEVTAVVNDISDRLNTARESIPSSWYGQDKLPLVTKHMKNAEMQGLIQAFDVPWTTAMAYNQSDPERASFGTNTWFNRGSGWAVAATQRIPLFSKVRLRGVVYTATLNTDPILELPAILRPAQNEMFPVNFLTSAGLAPGTIRIYTDGTVAIWTYGFAGSTIPTDVTYLSLSGIEFEGAF